MNDVQQQTSHLWLPFTQMRDFDRASRTFVRGEGNELFDARGKGVFDAVSSIWTIVHGHCHPVIVEAIARQAARLDHATLLGATNPVAEDLAERLCALTGLDYAFFAGDGASAIEAALKMAIQYWQHRGQPQRTRFVRLVDAYHGDTAGAMSLSDIAAFRSRFGALTFETLPYERAGEFGGDVAAVVVEPLVQAAAGMRMVPAALYENLKNVEPLLIVDEIATGFGRTGTMFAFERLGLRPDLACVGKGLTGGALALSATLVRERVYEAFLGARGDAVQFFHGHSYAGNPIACAAALASLDLFQSEATLQRAESLSSLAARRLDAIGRLPAVRETRQAGLMIGVELQRGARSGETGARVAAGLYERGHFTRPIGDVVQFVPPLSSTDAQVDAFFDALAAELAASSYLHAIELELQQIRDAGRYREISDGAPAGVDFSSNDYLGLASEPQVVEALRRATRAGSAGARLLGGAHREHRLLEEELAAWLGRERVLLFSSGYHAALGAIPVLARAVGGTIASDELNHASLIDGVRLAKSPRIVYPHANFERGAIAGPALLVTESVFSMGGDAVELPALLDVLGAADALLVDEAHALGRRGPGRCGARARVERSARRRAGHAVESVRRARRFHRRPRRADRPARQQRAHVHLRHRAAAVAGARRARRVAPGP